MFIYGHQKNPSKLRARAGAAANREGRLLVGREPPGKLKGFSQIYVCISS